MPSWNGLPQTQIGYHHPRSTMKWMTRKLRVTSSNRRCIPHCRFPSVLLKTHVWMCQIMEPISYIHGSGSLLVRNIWKSRKRTENNCRCGRTNCVLTLSSHTCNTIIEGMKLSVMNEKEGQEKNIISHLNVSIWISNLAHLQTKQWILGVAMANWIGRKSNFPEHICTHSHLVNRTI